MKVDTSINTFFWLALLDCGIGTTHLNTVSSELNNPVVEDKLVKRYERIVGKEIEQPSHHRAIRQPYCRGWLY